MNPQHYHQQPPPQQQQPQQPPPQPKTQMDMNVQASIMREQSIVVPTMSQPMLHEFNERNTERLSRAAGQPSSNPFDMAPMQEELKQVAPAAAVPAPAPAYATPAQQRNKAAEDAQLVGVLVGYLRRRREQQAGREAAEVGELSGQIKAITGQTWTTHWQPLHGPLTDFAKAHHDNFTVMRNKYVVLVGFEGEANIPVADSVAHLSQPTPAPAVPTALDPSHAASLNQLAAQHQQYAPHQHQPQLQPQPQPYVTGFDPLQQQLQQQQQQQYSTNPYGAPAPAPGGANPFGQQPQQPYAYEQPAQYAPAPVPAPVPAYAPAPSQQQQQQQLFPQGGMALPPASPATNGRQSFGAGPSDDAWVLFDDESDLNAPIANPFGAAMGASAASAAPSGSDWMAGFEDPLAAFTSPSTSAAAAAAAAQAQEEEVARAARKSLRKEAKLKLKQESSDEALARKMQEEEDARAAAASSQSASASAGVPASSSSRAASAGAPKASDAIPTPTGTKVAMTHPEIRELAEREIGKENVRLLAGFSVIKHGRAGRGHQRRLWVNSSLTHLAWTSSQFDGSHRGLELSKVLAIKVGEMTPNIRRSTKDTKKVKNLCFSLQTHARTLDLQACSVIQRDALAAAIKKCCAWNHAHKPRRLDRYRTEIIV